MKAKSGSVDFFKMATKIAISGEECQVGTIICLLCPFFVLKSNSKDLCARMSYFGSVPFSKWPPKWLFVTKNQQIWTHHDSIMHDRGRLEM